MRENRLSGLMRGERVALHGMRILSHVRGNPETDVGRSLNRATRSSTLPRGDQPTIMGALLSLTFVPFVVLSLTERIPPTR